MHSNLPILFCNPVALLKCHHIILIYCGLLLSWVVLRFSLYNMSLLQRYRFSRYLDILNSDLFSYVFATPFQIFCKFYKFTPCSIIQAVQWKIEQNRTGEKSLKDVTAVPSCFVRKLLINTVWEKYLTTCVSTVTWFHLHHFLYCRQSERGPN